MGSFDLANLAEAKLLGVALAMDAMAVTLSNSLCEPHMPFSKKIAMPIAFAIFQVAMPIAGFFGGTLIAGLIDAYAGIVSLAILAFVGASRSRRSSSRPSPRPSTPSWWASRSPPRARTSSSIPALSV